MLDITPLPYIEDPTHICADSWNKEEYMRMVNLISDLMSDNQDLENRIEQIKKDAGEELHDQRILASENLKEFAMMVKGYINSKNDSIDNDLYMSAEYIIKHGEL